jgi:hypothetical protein
VFAAVAPFVGKEHIPRTLSYPSTLLKKLRRVEGRVSSVLLNDHEEISEKVQKSL